MKIDGTGIAEQIYQDLAKRVGELKQKGITPSLAVVLVGDNPASVSFTNQKKKFGDYIGANVEILTLPTTISEAELLEKVRSLNTDPKVHGIIVQLPLPEHISEEKIVQQVAVEKDIDGFLPGSPFDVPVARAVHEILYALWKQSHATTSPEAFHAWLSKQDIVLLGRGKTAGKPIADCLAKQGITPTIITHATENPQEVMRKADIIISAVGKPEIVTPETIKEGAIVIGVGLFRGEDGKMHGDYKSKAIAEKAAFYTPTIGGVGPVNVAMLLSNLIQAAEINN